MKQRSHLTRSKVATPTMADSEDMRLQRMGLVQLPNTNKDDEAVGEDDFDTRQDLYEKLTDPTSGILNDKKAFTGNKSAFETSEYDGNRQMIPCFLPVPVLKIQGWLPNKLSTGPTDKRTSCGELTTWAMEETAEWCKEYATFDTIKGRDMMQDMKIASNPETYVVPEYSEKIPSHVTNAEEKYKRLYLEKHIKKYKDLKMEHINVTYNVLQCNFPLHRDSEASQHYKKVHLLRNGASDLRKRDIITVDTSGEFKIEDLTHFESYGPLKQSNTLDSIHTHVIARGVFEAGSNRNGAELQKSSAKKFMDGMKTACKGNFFDRFRYALKTIIKREVDDNFSCIWENVETALYQAVGQENKVKRLYGFNKITASSFYGKPLEIIIANVDEKINEIWGDSQIMHKISTGKMVSIFGFTLIYKYTLILGIVENLGSDFGQVKDVIEQEITSMLEKPTTLMEIPDFQKKLVQDFITRHVILTFRNKEVPKPNQKNVSSGEFSEKKQESANSDQTKEEYVKLKKPIVKDWETAKELADTIKGLTNDENKGLTLLSVPAVVTWLKEKNWRICVECMSANCQLTQYLNRKHKLPAKFLGNCKGKAITVGDIPEITKTLEKNVERSKKNAENAKKRHKKKGGLQNATTRFETKATNYNNDSNEFFRQHPDLLEKTHHRQSEYASARLCPLEISAVPELDIDTLPNILEMDNNGSYSCYVCAKPKMNRDRYDRHMFSSHTCDLANPDMDEISFARAAFEDAYEDYSPEERATAYWDYDSETHRRYSEDDSNDDSGNENYNENRANNKPKISTGYSSSSSSSSSSSNKSQNRPSKKRKTKKKVTLKKVEKDDPISDDKIEYLKNELKTLNSKFNTITSQERIFEQKNNQIEKIFKDIISTSEDNTKENNMIQDSIVQLIKLKNTSINENEENRKNIQNECERISDWIKNESSAREMFNNGIMEKYNQIELSMNQLREESKKNSLPSVQLIREECKKPHFGNLKEAHIPETENCKISMAGNKSASQDTIINDNPAVNIKNTLPLNIENCDTPSTSVRKEQYETPKLGVNHHSENTVDGAGTIKGKSKVKQVNNQAKLKELSLKNSFKYCQLFSTQLFELIIKMLSNKLAWGLLFTMLFHLSAADTNIEKELSTISNGNLETISIPGSNLPNISSIVIYTTATIIVQTAVINMSHVEDDISKRINNARDSTAVEQKLCKDYPLHCPMANLIMKEDKKTITEGNRALRNIKIVCKNKDENNDHLHLSNPIIYSTIYGSATHDTMTAISQASALSQAHSIAGTETPKRSNNIQNATHSKTGSWSIPEERTRQESEALKTHFMPAINAILEHEHIKGNENLEALSTKTATVVTILIPTDTKSTHCATRLIATTLSVPIANQKSKISVIKENNKLYQKNGTKEKYLLLPHGSTLSKQNLNSNTETYLTTRLCWVDQSISANSSQSEDPLIQTITVISPHNISISERCLIANSWNERKWTLAPYTKFTLPITCQLSSEVMNCSSVKIKTNNGNAFPGLQSTILEQNWEPEHLQGHPSTPSSLVIALLATLAAYTGIRILVKCIKSALYGYTDKAIITINPIIPINPVNPINHNTPSAPTFQSIKRSPSYFETPERTNSTLQEVTQLNSRMEFFAKYKANSINGAINLCNLMGSNLDESTQRILDDYLKETLEMDMDHEEIEDYFNYSNQEETMEMYNTPEDTDLPFPRARLC